MSVFALNMKFDLEEFDQSKVQVSDAGSGLNSTTRGKFRGQKMKALLGKQQVQQKQEEDQKEDSILEQILNEKE
jgi:hypothetical protein